MVEDILDLEDDIQELISTLERKHGIGITHISILRKEEEENPVGNLEIKTQWIVASTLDR